MNEQVSIQRSHNLREVIFSDRVDPSISAEVKSECVSMWNHGKKRSTNAELHFGNLMDSAQIGPKVKNYEENVKIKRHISNFLREEELKAFKGRSVLVVTEETVSDDSDTIPDQNVLKSQSMTSIDEIIQMSAK